MNILLGQSLDVGFDTVSRSINGFNGDFTFLSNFHSCDIKYAGINFSSSEHAYVWSKCEDKEFRNLLMAEHRPGKLKHMGAAVQLRSDWDSVRLNVMREILFCKFKQNISLREKLIATGGSYLEETNYWNDEFWGVCNGVGNNHLGQLLMLVRTILKRDYAAKS